MSRIHFPNSDRYEFVAQVLAGGGRSLLAVTLMPEVQAVEVESRSLACLLRRFAEGSCSVLPFVTRGVHAWLLTGSHRRGLERAAAQLGHFVVPTYAQFGEGSRPGSRQPFDPASGHPIHILGATLFPDGYYRLQSPPDHLEQMLERLGLWCTVLDRQPPAAPQPRPTYLELIGRFHAALAAAAWEEASLVISELERFNLSTADNLRFLQVQLLAQQAQWRTLWEAEEFETLAGLRLPRTVRAVLLESFYRACLSRLEQEERWEEAISAYRQARPRLRNLLAGRFGLTDGAVLRVFGYEAHYEGSRSDLADLAAAATDPLTQQVLQALVSTLPAEQPVSLSLPAGDQLRQALVEGNYDAALEAVALLPPEEQAIPLLSIAFQSGVREVAEAGLESYWDLPEAVQHTLQEADFRLPFYLEAATALALLSGGKESPAPPLDWHTWLEQALDRGDEALLTKALPDLADQPEPLFWEAAQITRLNELLLAIVAGIQKPTEAIRRGIEALTTVVMKDRLFPRENWPYLELYELLYTAALERSERNMTNSLTVLRLAEVLLRASPKRRDEVAQHFQDWFAHPIPALDSLVLDSFELLAEYGLHGGTLANCYREWLVALLALPTQMEWSRWEGWSAAAGWIQPGADLLTRLGEVASLAQEMGESDAIALLPAGYRISIFSFRSGSAARAKEMLLKRNPSLDIRLIAEKDMSGQARAAAEHADLPVVVTTCISHALTDGIGPYLQRDPVYPASSGSTSILRAVEAAVGAAQ